MFLVITIFALSPQPLTVQTLPNQDKWEHILAFAVLQALASLLFRAHVLPVAGMLVTYAGSIELIQSTMPGRTGSWADWGAGVVGILLALLVHIGITRYRAGLK
ncbi:VanZ family protein [Perlucidibaca aquatica]|uniref:VanZ family protein n=1 Tax=Perlucidibaca aquatica TaxID=1852776 RepID=UPI001D0D0A9F